MLFTNCVFEELCFPESPFLIVFSAKHSSCSKKMYVEKTKNYEKSGLFLNMARRCCLFVFFSGLNVFVVCCCVFVKVAKVLTMLVFSVLGAFGGWHVLVYLVWKV